MSEKGDRPEESGMAFSWLNEICHHRQGGNKDISVDASMDK